MVAFVGTFEHTLDSKGRLVLPRKFRAHLTETAILAPGGEGRLALWTPDRFDDQLDRLTELGREGRIDRRAVNWLTSESEEVTIDQQGRVLISDRLRSSALLEGEVVLTGARHSIEIWNREKHAESVRGLAELGTEILEMNMGL